MLGGGTVDDLTRVCAGRGAGLALRVPTNRDANSLFGPPVRRRGRGGAPVGCWGCPIPMEQTKPEVRTGAAPWSGSGAFGPNAWLVEDMYDRFRADPTSVSDSWREFFTDYKPVTGSPASAPAPSAPAATATTAPARMLRRPRPRPRHRPGNDGPGNDGPGNDRCRDRPPRRHRRRHLDGMAPEQEGDPLCPRARR